MYRITSDTYRDKKRHNSVILYHASPNKLSSFMPRSKLLDTGKVGLFFSQSYNSLISDWMPYVKDRKESTHPLAKSISDLYDRLDKLEGVPNPSNEIILEINSVRDRLERLKDKLNSDPHSKTMGGYKTIYIHTVSCPVDVYKLAKRNFKETYENDPVKSFGFWAWGDQIFIEDKYLPLLEIIKVDTLNTSDYHNRYKDVSLNRHYDNPNYGWRKQMVRDNEERKQRDLDKELAKKNDNPNRYDYMGELKKRQEEFLESRKKIQ